jgi:hypothetical protein
MPARLGVGQLENVRASGQDGARHFDVLAKRQERPLFQSSASALFGATTPTMNNATIATRLLPSLIYWLLELEGRPFAPH